RMVERHHPDLADPELAFRLLHDIRQTIGPALARPETQERFLELREILKVLVRPVPDLVTMVDELTRAARSVFGNTNAESARPQKPATRSSELEATALPVTMYLSDEAAHADVQAAVEALLATAGLEVLDREDPILGSWFRRMRATISRTARSQAFREGALTAAHIADARLVLVQDATITATMMQNVGPLITSLQPTKDAVVRIGAVLVVKVDWEVRVLQLTAAQQAVLDHRPQLATSPRDVIGAIGLIGASDSRSTTDSSARTAADR
ncbi:hypothetical protein, partial [Streptomyces sediminimaris]|uniref:hypothetical protein n=1 Tax=Streptomyces sediminimaris TaxID=3383721 RepID=UPI00399BC051